MTAGTLSKKALLALIMAFFAIGMASGCSSSEESSAPPTETQEGGDSSDGGNPDQEVGGMDDECNPDDSAFADIDCVGGG